MSHRRAVAVFPTKEGLLNDVLSVGDGSRHTIGKGGQMRAMLVEHCSLVSTIVQRASDGVSTASPPTRTTEHVCP